MPLRACLAVPSFALFLAACSGALVADTAHVAGNGTLSGRIHAAAGATLPAGGVATVELVDLSLENGPDQVVTGGPATAKGGGYVFSLGYDPAAIRPNHTYALRARVTGGGRVMASTRTVYVLTYGFPARANLRVAPVRETAVRETAAPVSSP